MLKVGAKRLFSAALCAWGITVFVAAAGTTNVVPFSDDFESYANLTPLIDGTNGWYASSNIVIVQTNTAYTNGGGTKAAMVPPYCNLSNRVVEVASSNIWVSMRGQSCLGFFEEPSTNTTALFGVGINGYCSVYNGTNGWTEISTTIDGASAPVIETNQWARFDLRLNHNNHTWALFVNYQLMRTNIVFVNTNQSSFSGFDVQGVGTVETNYTTPSTTSYLDNVAVSYTPPTNLTEQTNNWRPVMAIDVTNVSRTIVQGLNAASNSFHVWKSAGYLAMHFTNSVTYTNSGAYTNWLSTNPDNGTNYGELSTVWLVFNTTNLPASNQPYQAVVQIDGTDDFFGISASNSPQSILVSVFVQSSPQLYVTPLNLTNSVTTGRRASGQNIYVANTGAPPRSAMAYTVSPGTNWISVSSSGGSVIDETNTVAFTYLTETLSPGWYTGLVTVTASGVATQTVSVAMRVNSIPVLSWNAGQLTWTNLMTEGETLANASFDVWNGSSAPTGTIQFTVSSDADWIELSPDSGTSSGERQAIAVTYHVSDLLPGEHTGTVTLAGVDVSTGVAASNSPLTIVANLTIRGKATLAVNVDNLSNSVLENAAVTNLEAFNIWNEAGTPRGGLSYTVTPSASWLSASPSSGIVTNDTNTIAVTWTAGSYAPGTYSGSIIVDGTDQLSGSRARNAPKTINVQMTVLSRTPVNYEKPTIYGTPYIGQTLTARNGLWQNMDRLTFTYQWQRANNISGAGMTSLAGETTSNHVVLAADRGKYMRIAVTATDPTPPPRSTTAYSDMVSTAKIKAAPGDFNGDGITDLWFFDPATGMWRASFGANSFAEGQFGSIGMTAVPGDYNGDGYLDLGLYESAHGMWHILCLPSGPALSGSMFGGLTEETQATPVPADYDGDGLTDVALYWRGYWAILYSSLGRIVLIPPIAAENATPVPADYDGDGIDDLGVYDAGLWTIYNALGELRSVSFGSAAWLPAPGDYDGDNIADLGIFSQRTNLWNMVYSSSGVTNAQSFGSSLGANLPLQGYYDHDPYCDPATLHDSTSGDFIIWCVTRTADTNFTYRGQTYQRSINDWRVSW